MSNSNASIVKREPVLTAASVAVLIVTLANVFGVVIDLDTVTNVIVGVTTIWAAVAARARVTPVA
jgi:hypothetical protein